MAEMAGGPPRVALGREFEYKLAGASSVWSAAAEAEDGWEPISFSDADINTVLLRRRLRPAAYQVERHIPASALGAMALEGWVPACMDSPPGVAPSYTVYRALP